jgi:hypothetical protein
MQFLPAGEIEKNHKKFEFLAMLDEFVQALFERVRLCVGDEGVGGHG